MYTGHIAVALGAECYRRRVPLTVLLLAAQAPDWIEQFFTVAGQGERAQLWSHSMPAVIVGMAIVAAAYALKARDRQGMALICAVYFSHPILDLVTGSKPWWPSGPRLGACLYNQPALDWACECVVLLLGWIVYRSALSDRRQKRLAVGLLFALLLCQTGIDAWQSFRIYRVGEGTWRCGDTPTASAPSAASHVAFR